ncbi:MAG: radical SAM family heme chaperone HemW [bacterium]|nr:radical SAM family heme chaperone HemW [bacterium]MDD5354075.1 radical SAM family heme chaperone HemW [bacterium]MDD5755753.1 radical SAM family heme chaperone HemW [bacterium]
MGVGLYLHFPFCQQKCHYCDFNSYAGMEHLLPKYLSAIQQELFMYKVHVSVVDTIYIGGGTPSLLSINDVTRLFDSIRRNFFIADRAEVTMEVNPGSCSLEKLKVIRMNGVNRLSIGLQSLNNESLRKMGRIHSVENFVQTYQDARQAGFTNINVDLIYGLPWQTGEEWQDTLAGVIDLNPEHISLYSLTIEHDTPFGRDLKAGRITRINEDLEAEMYENAVKLLKANGYDHYEISNFAKPGKRCRHNQIYWRNEDYVGIGAGATSYMGRVRFTNVKEIPQYIEKVFGNVYATVEKETLKLEKIIGETIMLNLRMLDGFKMEDLRKRFKTDINEIYGPTIKVLSTQGLLKEEEGNVKLTEHGLMIANQVFERFV